MNSKKLDVLILLCCVALTLLAIGVFQYIPPKTFTIFPSNLWRQEIFISYSSDFLAVGNWDSDDQQQFTCKGQNTSKMQMCGINFFYGKAVNEGMDLSGYNKIKIGGEISGNGERVLLFIRNYNSDYSRVDDSNSAKYLYVNIQAAEFKAGHAVEVGFDEFSVSDWWKSSYLLNRKQLIPEFGNVPTIGLEVANQNFPKMNTSIKISNIQVEGPMVKEEHWYLAIMGFWMSVIMGVVLRRFYVLTRSTRIYANIINGLVTDKAYLETESKKFQRLSSIDRLTGALNRLGVEEYIHNSFTKKHSHVIGLTLIDVDHFKHVNDIHGHDVGDYVLKILVEIVQHNIRPDDIIGRWGGEEFIILTPNTEENTTFRIAEKIRVLFEQRQFSAQTSFSVSASFGITTLLPNESFDVALKRADVALYKAKEQGRNRTIIGDK